MLPKRVLVVSMLFNRLADFATADVREGLTQGSEEDVVRVGLLLHRRWTGQWRARTSGREAECIRARARTTHRCSCDLVLVVLFQTEAGAKLARANC